MKIEELNNKKILILGYGKEGQSTEQYFKATLTGSSIEHADKKSGLDYLEHQKDYDLIIKTPGIPKALITQQYTTATNIFFANCKGTIIGVTGTKGKSTTSSLIYHILKTGGKQVHLVGNIGNPALSELLKYNGRDDIFVMELSSYQLDDIHYSPHISVILNLFPEHMNYHGEIAEYYNAKKNIVKFVKPGDYFIYNPTYINLGQWASDLTCHTVPFLPHDIPASDDDLTIQGDHNRDNIQAALTVVDLFHISKDDTITALKTFKPLPHRLQNIGTFHDITFYDDAISTTPESTIAALQTLKDVDTLFLGGEDRGYDFSALVNIIIKKAIRNIVLFPNSGEKIRGLLKSQSGYQPQVLETRNMADAVEFAFTHTKKNSICLLSTASPSYSVWKNFEEKGDLFKLYVSRYEKN
ncbi:UDP-N-acetylmuramoyl-L-alanine--D-glutamate ligase [Candidatus Roizmanbacteria bacterium]|nr:UDP-N-acetylmuramoyl-L-alanine--D-glutamate ligase [Candidatus Roizmanbacteria bacterium]